MTGSSRPRIAVSIQAERVGVHGCDSQQRGSRVNPVGGGPAGTNLVEVEDMQDTLEAMVHY